MALQTALLAFCAAREGVAAKLRLGESEKTPPAGRQTYTNREIPGLRDDESCTDALAGWKDISGHDCKYYLDEGYCTRREGSVLSFKYVANYLHGIVADDASPENVCCACGGGFVENRTEQTEQDQLKEQQKRCNGTCAELKEAAVSKAASKVQEEYEKAAAATGKAVSTAGASAVAQAAVEVNAQVAKVSSALQENSHVETGNVLDDEEMRFGQLTEGAEIISQVAKANFMEHGGDAAAFEISAQLSLGASSRLKEAADKTNLKFQQAHKAWEETRELAMQALFASNQAGKVAAASLQSEMANLSSSIMSIEEIAAKASTAEQFARELQEKTLVVSDITQQVKDREHEVSNELKVLEKEVNAPVEIPKEVMHLNAAIEEQKAADAAVAAVNALFGPSRMLAPAMQAELAAATSRRDAAANRISQISILSQGVPEPISSDGIQMAFNRRQALEQELETLLSIGESSLSENLTQQLVANRVVQDGRVATLTQRVADLQKLVDAVEQHPEPTAAPCSNVTVHGWQQELADIQVAEADSLVLDVAAKLNMTRTTQELNSKNSLVILTADQAQNVQTSLDNALIAGFSTQASALQSQLTAHERAEKLREMIANADCTAALGEIIDTGMTPSQLADRNDNMIQQLSADISALESKPTASRPEDLMQGSENISALEPKPTASSTEDLIQGAFS